MVRIQQNMQAFARHFPLDFAVTVLFNTACAIMLTYVVRTGAPFWDNFVFSMCIGLLAQAFIDGGRLLLWGESSPPKIPFYCLLIIAAPIAYFLGMALAARILGISLTNAEVRLSQHTTGLFIFTLFACLFATWIFWNRTKVAQLQIQAEAEKARATAIEKQALQAQLQLLQAQIEPHMLFNTLANLQALIASDVPRAQHLLYQLIQYLRATLSSSRTEKTTLDHEFLLIQAYLELMSVRMGSRLRYSLYLPEHLGKAVIVPMLLQPLVENAIQHGLEPKIEGGWIEVEAHQEANMLRLSVKDTGLGFNSTKGPIASNNSHLGLSNIRERLQALYGHSASLSLIPNTPVGTIAQIALPLES